MRLKVIACEIMFREVAHEAAHSKHVVDLEFMQKGLHDNPDTLRERVQAAIDAVDPEKHQAVVLGYALCSNGVVGLQATQVPLVVPRAHDCITLFLGSRQGYAEYFSDRPGSYYYTAGWIERDGDHVERTPAQGEGLSQSWDELVEKYGEDNARYLLEFQNSWVGRYDTAAWVDMELSAHVGVEEHARQVAAERDWTCHRLPGSARLFAAMLAGDWARDDFLILDPGERVVATHDDLIIGKATPD
jgi:hypothetical protein